LIHLRARVSKSVRILKFRKSMSCYKRELLNSVVPQIVMLR
jgi:hypothetical protein